MLRSLLSSSARTIPQLQRRALQRRDIASFESIPRDSVVFSGIQPTGVPHIGNYLGALRQWVRLQETSSTTSKLIFSVVDLHALTVDQDKELLKQWKRETLATLLAIGLDPQRCTIFFQSDVQLNYKACE